MFLCGCLIRQWSGVVTLSEGPGVSWASPRASVERSQLRPSLEKPPALGPRLSVPGSPSRCFPPTSLLPLPLNSFLPFCQLSKPRAIACTLSPFPSISMLKYQQARMCHSRGPLILFCCFEESTLKDNNRPFPQEQCRRLIIACPNKHALPS